MRYLAFVCADESLEVSEEEGRAIGTATEAWVEEMTARGIRVTGQRLASITDATTVRVRDGEVLISDGPFAETKEQIAGFDVLECADLDEALAVSAAHPMARIGTIEVRPFWPE